MAVPCLSVWNLKLLLFSIVIVLKLGLKVDGTQTPIQCVDDDGKSVDWYIVYKFPYLKSSNQTLFGGFRYATITSEAILNSSNEDDGWHFSSTNITEPDSIFGKTLQPFFGSQRSSLSSIFYNDQPPSMESVSSSYAHSKGLMLADNKTGFWLIHTVPKFSFTNKSYEFVASGGRYGQVALCVSMSTTELAKVIEENFLVANPYVYSINFGQQSNQNLTLSLTKLKNKEWKTNKNYSDLIIQSLDGFRFRSFYKSPSDHIDLYAGIVAPKLNTSLKVETWRHPPGHPLNSSCSIKTEQVENVEKIKLTFFNSKLTGSFDWSEDHSKWAISSDEKHQSVCLGDINRVESQFRRGGGTTCLSNLKVWKAFNNMIEKVENCQKKMSFWRKFLKNIGF